MASYRSYGPQPYRTDSVWDGVDRGYKFGNSLRDDVTRSRAGAALAGGDLQGSANALLMNGDFDNGLKVRQAGIDADAKRLAGEKARKDEGLKYIEQAASRLADIHRSGKDPAKTAAAFDQYFAQGFRDAGEDEADIAQLRTGLLTDPDTTLMALGAGAAKELGYDVRNAGDEVIIIDKATGREVRRYRGAKTVTLGEGVDLVDVPGTYDSAPEGDVPSPPEPPAASLEPDASPAENIRGIVDRLVSAGARITSARRSPEENARVRGAKNSYHLRGQAFDIVPPPGMSMSELADQLRRTGVDFAELINEGDHVHIAWNDAKPPGAAPVASDVPGGARVIARGRPKQQEQWVDLPGGGQRNTLTGKTEGVPKTSGRLSATVIKLQDDLLRDLGAASSVNTLIDKFSAQLDAGELNLGPVSNLGAQARNFVGASDAGTRNFASFKAALEKMRNDSLRLNKGVQTEGDAQRAWNELLDNINDEGVVVQRLAEIKALNEQAIALRSDLVNQAREDSGFEPMDTDRFRAKPLPQGDGGLPAAARAQLREGQITTFQNGQRWTLRGGKPQRVN